MQDRTPAAVTTDSGLLYATNRLIESVWTLGYRRISETQVEILSYDRENPIGYEQERQLPQCSLVEVESRVVAAIRLYPYSSNPDQRVLDNGELLTVTNPQFIFSYSK